MYNGTTKPNGSIAGARGAGGSTGNRTMANSAPKGPAGTYANHYGPGAAGGKGKGKMPLSDHEAEPGEAKGPDMQAKTPMNTAGVGANDYMQALEDEEQEPGAAPRKKKAPPQKFKTIQQLRDYANSRGMR